MTCYHPIYALYNKSRINPATGRPYPPCSFTQSKDTHSYISDTYKPGYEVIKLPCGNCIGCRIKRSAEWAIRCVHEASLHEHNMFLTLTFDDAHINPDMSLHPEDFVKFMKRYRKSIEPRKVRFFHCGEYGDKNQRPHHHAIIFGHKFDDLETWNVNHLGQRLYRSPSLERLWPYGFSTIGDVTYQSAAYVARYCLKKVTGKQSKEYYGHRVPPYITMSRRPGIGKDWLDQWIRDVYPNDYCVKPDGTLMPPPRFYDKHYEDIIKEITDKYLTLDELKELRKERAQLRFDKEYDSEPEYLDRMEVKEFILQHRLEKLERKI